MEEYPIFYFRTIDDGLIIFDVGSDLVIEANQAAAAMHGYSREEFVGLRSAAFIHPDSHHQFHEYVRTVQPGDAFEAVAVHIRQNGLPFTVEVLGTALIYQDRPCLFSIVREVSELEQTERSLQRAMGADQREQNMLLEGSQTLAPKLELKPGLTLDQLQVIYEQVRTLAVLQERQRLAQNLHDAVNQSLFSASLMAEVLPRLWERHPDEVRESLEDLRRLTRGALAEMRGLLVELRPLVLADSELDDLLRLLGDALTGRTNIPVAVTVAGRESSGPGTLPADVQTAFYRLCQEALNNIAKHSGASQVAIHLQYEGNAVTLSIRDDGRGFEPGQIPSGHYGVSMMHERAKAVGAVLSITSRPGQGTEIAVHWQAVPEPNAL